MKNLNTIDDLTAAVVSSGMVYDLISCGCSPEEIDDFIDMAEDVY